MEMRNNPSKWYYWGRWVSVMLFTSQWIDFKKTTTFKEMGLGSLSGSMKLLNSYYYLFKEDVEYVNKIIIEKFERVRS